jgi:hypothetical protein
MLPDDPKIGNKYSVPQTNEKLVVIEVVYNNLYPSTIEYFKIYFCKNKTTRMIVWHIFISFLIKNNAVLEKKCPIVVL